MVAWVWVAVAALAVVALQAFLFHRARQNWGVDGDGSRFDTEAIDPFAAREGGHADQVDDGVLCPNCGEYNREEFSYCQRCVDRFQ